MVKGIQRGQRNSNSKEKRTKNRTEKVGTAGLINTCIKLYSTIAAINTRIKNKMFGSL